MMKPAVRILILASVIILSLACSYISIDLNSPPPTPATQAPGATPTSMTPTTPPTPAVDVTPAVLDPCSLVTSADVEAILGEPAGAPALVNGGCAFTNAKDALFAVSVGAAQGDQAGSILQGQAMLLGFAGAPLDPARMDKLKAWAEAGDFKAFFDELIAAAQGVPTVQTRLVADDASDLVYWAWISAPPRRQGAYVAVRGRTLVNVNLVVAETQTEDAMLAASAALAGKIFERLPSVFVLPQATSTPTLPPTPTPIPSPTWVGLPAPALLSPQNGAVLNDYPRSLTLQWSPVAGAVKYGVEVEACANGNPSDCFPLISNETTAVGYYLQFVGMQPGRWRVWAVDGSGNAGVKSDWWVFTFTR